MESRGAAKAEPEGPVAVPVRRTARRAAINSRTNLMLIVAVSLAAAMELAGLPFLLRLWGALALWLIVPVVVLTPTHWGLIHEAIHGQLFANRRLNENVGALKNLEFSKEELAEIDRHATEGGVNLWEKPSTDQPV